MEIHDLPTPLVLVDLEKLENNILSAARMVKDNGKALWPMFKTTKSTFIAKLQRQAGATGFLCGSLAEAEALIYKGITSTVMLAYPIADKNSLNRLIKLIESDARVILRIDNFELANLLNECFKSKGLKVEYCIKVDVDYHRLGVKPNNVGRFAHKLQRFSNLKFIGIVTHQGNAYRANSPREVEEVAKNSAELMHTALLSLKEYGFEPEIVGAGSTPTFRFDVKEPIYTHLFPGNYVYYDRTQALVYGSASINDCALTLLSTIISIPEHSNGGLAVINAGSRYFDREIRGGLKGYGQLLEYPNAIVNKVSQEIALVKLNGEKVGVGDKVRVLINHACYTNNAADFLVMHRGGRVENIVSIDAREDFAIKEMLMDAFAK